MKEDFKIIDISLPLNSSTVIYPNNPKVEIEENIDKRKGLTVTDSKITLGSHTGTHIDAPRHVFEDGATLDQIPLEQIVGKCRVLDFTDAEESIKTSDLEKHDIKEGERILAKTKNSEIGFDEFRNDYIYLDGNAAEYLAKKRVALFGIDYLSVKQRGSEDIRPHTELLKNNIVIFEGLDLSQVEEGEYMFVGLPIRFTGIDGSPARAILLK
ncbi:MAG: cyclase family protein [Candidatus Paceibacteria bacterium]